jgi:hypothetical protein
MLDLFKMCVAIIVMAVTTVAFISLGVEAYDKFTMMSRLEQAGVFFGTWGFQIILTALTRNK